MAKISQKQPANEAEDDEDVKSISSDDVIVETKKKGRNSKGSNSHNERLPIGKANKKQKKTKEAESSTSRSYLKKQSKNDIEEGENNESEEQEEKCLKGMGFERMIHFPIVELPSALAYHAIEHFHPGSMELRLEKGSIKATRQKVHDMLGIPMGSGKLEDLEQRPNS
ncbi:hypothetical protein Tco_0840901 [Tanacetum coccineum]|uniref:Uncharacterized protein n=1 Tax=Tanacetum coccineum TaxID=301880 RepID=A0ABQ5AWR0_9ASTR